MPRVLVIDDDPALLRVLRISLTARDYEVVVATNGAQGITETALQSPDVVLLDLGLPDIDGVEVCRRIREWSQVPVIVLSSGSPSGTRRKRRGASSTWVPCISTSSTTRPAWPARSWS